jgi:hypothetical protein
MQPRDYPKYKLDTQWANEEHNIQLQPIRNIVTSVVINDIEINILLWQDPLSTP